MGADLWVWLGAAPGSFWGGPALSWSFLGASGEISLLLPCSGFPRALSCLYLLVAGHFSLMPPLQGLTFLPLCPPSSPCLTFPVLLMSQQAAQLQSLFRPLPGASIPYLRSLLCLLSSPEKIPLVVCLATLWSSAPASPAYFSPHPRPPEELSSSLS